MKFSDMSAKSMKRPQSLKIPMMILGIAKFLELIAPKALTLFAARLFTTPIRHKMPKRELEMDRNSTQSRLFVPGVSKEINVYEYGSGTKKALLIHGWSGRGTQLVKIADALLKDGFSVISFDAPAHGKSEGKTTLMPEFIAAILEIEKKFGPFQIAVGHSLGGMSVLNAAAKGFNVDKIITIGSGDVVEDIIDDFIKKLRIKPNNSGKLRKHFEKKSGETMNSFSAYIAAKKLNIPVLVIHDNDDYEVPVSAAKNIYDHLKNGEIMLTNGLGHRKILGDGAVIKKIISFINDENNENEMDFVAGDFNADRVSRADKRR